MNKSLVLLFVLISALLTYVASGSTSSQDSSDPEAQWEYMRQARLVQVTGNTRLLALWETGVLGEPLMQYGVVKGDGGGWSFLNWKGDVLLSRKDDFQFFEDAQGEWRESVEKRLEFLRREGWQVFQVDFESRDDNKDFFNPNFTEVRHYRRKVN